ncbi:hypothetical protein T02_6402 [Trichinella nativa]|uniref:Uncharacterized protein n=1 Tax=Trichinella nativa TaxID=6335 RepID=A0A0V1KH48_9BILA|nr:hypothetical protein T02_6402 [Trichinella nativa]
MDGSLIDAISQLAINRRQQLGFVELCYLCSSHQLSAIILWQTGNETTK